MGHQQAHRGGKRKPAKWDDGVTRMAATLGEDAAKIGGVWQTDGSQHKQTRRVNAGDSREPTVHVPPRDGRRSLRVLHLFSGVERRASIAHFLQILCKKEGVGLDFFDVDIHVGGSALDLLDDEILGRRV